MQKVYQRERILVAVYELADLRLDNWPRRVSVPDVWDWQRDTNCGCRHKTPEETENCDKMGGWLPQTILRIPDPDSPNWEDEAERIDAWQVFVVNTKNHAR